MIIGFDPGGGAPKYEHVPFSPVTSQPVASAIASKNRLCSSSASAGSKPSSGSVDAPQVLRWILQLGQKSAFENKSFGELLRLAGSASV